MTTEDLLTENNYLSFFAMSNREKGGNCEFIMEIFEGDNLIYLWNKYEWAYCMKLKNGKFGYGYDLISHPLEVYFNANDFVNMDLDVSSCS